MSFCSYWTSAPQRKSLRVVNLPLHRLTTAGRCRRPKFDMNSDNVFQSSNRRRFLQQAAAAGLGSLFLDVQGLFAEQLLATPEQTEGPYYPTTLPLDTDNDLLLINSNLTSAIGQVTYLSGRILNPSGEPVRNATMEIWHADNSGAYIHPSSMGYSTRDLNFQGFGRFLTGSSGEYLFRTIKPGVYTGRTRHIHFKVKVPGFATLTSQLYILGEAQNTNDSVLNGIRDAQARSSVIVPFAPIPGSTVGAGRKIRCCTLSDACGSSEFNDDKHGESRKHRL
jgi:protocatechuate 3,4-dioxygenase, beta subunit